MFDLFYISKEDCIAMLEQSGASEEQIEGFKVKNASQGKTERSKGFPYWEPKFKYAGKDEGKAKNKTSTERAVPDSTREIEMF